MKSNSYYVIKNYIHFQLQKIKNALEPNDISNEIKLFRDLLSGMGITEVARIILRTEGIVELNESEWALMQKELETEFDVKIERGYLIQGEDQQKRDPVWWSDDIKQKVENYYWDRYKEYIRKSLPQTVVKTIDEDTDVLMNNIGDPSYDSFKLYGMAVGHVQSGKTANYAALICKAADAGYKFIVVIAGGINNLRNQTQIRMNEAFVGQDKGTQVGAGIGMSESGRIPISLTTAESDFNNRDATRNLTVNFYNTSVPILLVIKKNTRTLDNVIDWLEKISKNQVSDHAMLLIDDESDYASINTKEEEDPTAINRKLRKLLNLFRKRNYVAYTATPYANIFIDHEASNERVGNDLFPQDFIYVIDAPSNYFGARKVFLDTNEKHLIGISDYKDYLHEKHKKDLDLREIPESMYDAVRLFIINMSIRYLRNDGDKHNSMLIHATRFTNVHEKISMFISNYIKRSRKEVAVYGSLPDAQNKSRIIKKLYETLRYHHNGSLEFSWKQILAGICKTIDTILVREVHQRTKIPLEYSEDRATNVIAIGGASLSRGYTLEGLSISYFLRNTIFYDTLMQMGRWFGYRKNYEDLCRIYMPETRIGHFARIIEATEDLIANFKVMSEAKRTPKDFGLAVLQDPDSALQITARNKQKHVLDFYLDINLNGKLKETRWLLSEPDDRKNNLDAIAKIVTELNDKSILEKVDNHIIWRNIAKEYVIKFLNDFKVYGSEESLGISVRMPLKFIKQYAIEKGNWDVALYSGTLAPYSIGGCTIKKQKRQVVLKENGCLEVKNRQVSSGNSESVTLPENERKLYKSDRKKARSAMPRPLLMLHILQTEEYSELAAFGVSFPDPKEEKVGNAKTIKVKINTVGVQNLFDEESLDEE